MNLFLGIDPGVSGGYALLDENGTLLFYTDFTNWKQAYIYFNNVLPQYMGDKLHTTIEKVGAMSIDRRSTKSLWTFAENFGGWLAFLSMYEIVPKVVRPQLWQSKILGHFPKGKSKKASLDFVNKKYPRINRIGKLRHGVSDAICIALYGLIVAKKGKNEKTITSMSDYNKLYFPKDSSS